MGYTAASTNAIAREAGVSPGTLYQFFPNKEAIAIELGERLTRQMREHHDRVLSMDGPEFPLDQTVDTVVDQLIAFNCQNPVFLTLIHGPDVPGSVMKDHDALHESLMQRVETIIGQYAPGLPAERRSHLATMAFALFKAGLELVMSHQGEEREAYVKELKAAMYGYLAPVAEREVAGPTDARR